MDNQYQPNQTFLAQGQAGRGQFMRPVQNSGYVGPGAGQGIGANIGGQIAGWTGVHTLPGQYRPGQDIGAGVAGIVNQGGSPYDQGGMGGMVAGMRNGGFSGGQPGAGQPPIVRQPWLPMGQGGESMGQGMGNAIAGIGGFEQNQFGRGNGAWLGGQGGTGSGIAQGASNYQSPAPMAPEEPPMSPQGRNGGTGSLQPDMMQQQVGVAAQPAPTARQQARDAWLTKKGRTSEVGGYNTQGVQGGSPKRVGGETGRKNVLSASSPNMASNRKNRRK